MSTRRTTSSLGRRPLGCALVAQRQGTSAVLATLWPVADGSTGRFMQLVYAGRQADETLPKGDALRRAQLTSRAARVAAASSATQSLPTRPTGRHTC